VIREFEQIIRKGKIRYESIAGIATAGIPYASILADHLKKPLLYVRSKPKEHGKGNQIEGRLERGKRVLVIEDLVSTGMSSLSAVKALRDAGAVVRHCLAIFSYGLASSQRAFEKAHCQLYTLTNLETLLTVALKDGWISLEEKHLIEKFSEDPSGWLKGPAEVPARRAKVKQPRKRPSSRR
jgi:orotate phosphoribosyltransferase